MRGTHPVRENLSFNARPMDAQFVEEEYT